MNLPKDWSKKPDWLERASEPKTGGWQAFQAVVAAILLVVCVAAFIGGFFAF